MPVAIYLAKPHPSPLATTPRPPGVHNNDLISFLLEFLHPFLRDDHRVHLSIAAIERNASFSGILLELVKCSSSERVRTDETRLPVLTLVERGKLRNIMLTIF